MDSLGIETIPRRFRGAVRGIAQSRREMWVIRSMPAGFFDTGKPKMPDCPLDFYMCFPRQRDAVIHRIWRKYWRNTVLTPWMKKQVKEQNVTPVKNLGSTTQESRNVTRHHGQWA